jgi:cell division protein FtsI/penicillin-binding protein 2
MLGGRLACLLAVGTLSAAPVESGAAPAKRQRRSVTRRPSAVPTLVLPPRATDRDRAVGEASLRALGRASGAVVAMDPDTGRVVALVNPANGLFKAYTPCSVFKIVVAIAGLSEGVIDRQSTHVCTDGCWMWPGHGPIDLRRALAVSCNPYFEQIGVKLGWEKIERYAQLLGLGTVSGINLTGETPGKVPQSVPASQVGHVSSHATGVAASAVQVAALLSATINGGVLYRPQVGPAEGFVPQERWRLPPGTVIDGLADGFLSAVNEGSALRAFDPEVVVAGKTGSCSHVGWFASYAPAEHPRLVIVVFLRGSNGHQASAVAGRIYQEIYRTGALPGQVAAGGS